MSFVRLADQTWPDAEALGGEAVGLIPTGALEQHGPHLPLGTDFLVAERLAQAAAEALPVSVVVTPVLTAGLSDHHVAFPGTVSLSRETVGGWIEAHVAGFERIGVRRVAVFSAHGGNFAFIGELAAQYAARGAPTKVIAYDDLMGFVRVMDEAARPFGLDAPPTDVHAGMLETSAALAVFPGLVRNHGDVDGYTAAEPGWMDRIWSEGLRALTETGVLGRPGGATAEAGEAIVAALARELAGWIAREFAISL